MSEPWEQLTFPESTLSLEDSPAPICQQRERAKALLVAAQAFGLSFGESSKNSGQDGLSSRTSPLVQADGSTPSAHLWVSAAMKRYRSLCRLTMSEHRTSESDSSSLPEIVAPVVRGGLLPTPTASDSKNAGGASQMRRRSPGLGALGHISPLFVEWVMGFPTGWTDSKP